MTSVGGEREPSPDQDPDQDADGGPEQAPPSEDRGGDKDRGNLDRRLADQKLVEAFAASGFTGPLYADFSAEMVRYGMSVTEAWLYSGRIFTLLSERGIRLNTSTWESQCLRNDPEAIGDITDVAVAMAWHKFEERALRGGEWKATGGATLSTYFMGRVIYEVPGPFKQWRRQLHEAAKHDLRRHMPSTRFRQGLDPAVQAADDCAMHMVLNLLPEPQQHAILLKAAGYDHGQIAEALALCSTRAVEGLVRRAKEKIREYLDVRGEELD